MALSTFARRRVFTRDKGICALCSCDTEFLYRISLVLRSKGDEEAMWLVKAAWGMPRTPWGAWSVANSWEADHTVPLAEGGTNELGNYRTLCVACHKDQTRQLRRRLAASRRVQETLPL
jgi:5-methylcytosine-specific restriction endonuclease McrA